MDKALLKEEYKRLLRQAVGDRTGSMALMMVLEEVDFSTTALPVRSII